MRPKRSRIGWDSLAKRVQDSLELYSTTALLHDFDYERHPSAEAHPFVWRARTGAAGVVSRWRCGRRSWDTRSIPACLGVTHLDKALFACDELAGFLTACALVKPTKAIADVEVASVRKKMKDKAFARGIHREDVIQGAAELGIDLDAHIGFCLEAMKKRAGELGTVNQWSVVWGQGSGIGLAYSCLGGVSLCADRIRTIMWF